jgi:hypothetical protein
MNQISSKEFFTALGWMKSFMPNLVKKSWKERHAKKAFFKIPFGHRSALVVGANYNKWGMNLTSTQIIVRARDLGRGGL